MKKAFHETKVFRGVATLLTRMKLRCYGVSFGARVRGNRVQIHNEGSISLGSNVSLRSYPGGTSYACGLRTYYPEARIEVGSHVNMNGALIHCNQSVVVGSHCMLGPGVILCDNDSHPAVLSVEGRKKRPPEAPIRLGSNVWLGMRTIVLKGVTIGDNTIVAAGSVVTQDLPPNILAGGVPAKRIRDLA